MQYFHPEHKPLVREGDTIVFTGDHITPQEPGYVGVAARVIERFHSRLRLSLVSIGAHHQTPAALRSSGLLDAIRATRAAWLVLAVGLADAFAEPATAEIMEQYKRWLASFDEPGSLAIGAEHRWPNEPETDGEQHEVGAERDADLHHPPQPTNIRLERLSGFSEDLRALVEEASQAGTRCVLLTTVVVGNDVQHPVNAVLRAYNQELRAIAAGRGLPVVDVEQAFTAVYERAATYKQRVALTIPPATLNPQGEALVARTFLDTMGLLPRRG
jgi:hypothetical protein